MTTIVKFPGVNLSDTAAMFHALADQIASGEYGTVRGAAYAFVTEDDDMYCNLMGRISQIEGVGLLTMAASMLQCEGDE